MDATKKKLWFAAKTYGWGWTPATWEGWLVIAIYLSFVFRDVRRIDATLSTGSSSPIVLTLPILIATTALIAVSYWKGEKPRWRWGKE